MNDANDHAKPAKNIILVGFMGSGKSTIGRELGKLLSYPLIDSDTQIVEQERMSVSEIFSLKGESYFRDCETSLVDSLLEQNTSRHILATGGGLPIRPENRETLRQLGYVVWLDADTETIFERTSRNDKRPLLRTQDPRKTIQEMLDERQAIYRSVAHLRVQTGDLDISETAHGILESARYFFGNT